MAVLPDGDRVTVWAQHMGESSAARETIGLVKVDLRAAVDATDDWIEDNATSYNNALPAAAKAALAQKQKVRLFMAVAQRRFDVEV